MTYDNNADKVTFIKKTGSDIINNNYQVDITTLLDSTTQLSTSTPDADEFIVVRKFDDSTISPSITADETWSAWVLPNSNSSGSTMYSLSGSTVTFSQTAADYTWKVAQSGRAADVTLPALASGDTIYLLRKTYALEKLVSWTAGSKITSKNLNFSGDQFLFLSQELMTLWQEFHNLNPSIGQPNGLCPLDSSGVVDSAYIDGNSIDLKTKEGVTGTGVTGSEVTLNLDGDSLTQGTSGVKADTQDLLTSTSATKPLSANQGKVLKDELDTLGTGITYKGAVDITSTDDKTTGAVAGWSYNVTTGGTPDSQWTGLSGTINAGSLIRYSGSQWDVVSSTTALQADGSVSLDASATWTTTAGTILVSTQSDNDNSTKAASTAYVDTAIAATPLTELANIDDDIDDTTGNMIFWNGTTWADVGLNDTTPGSNKILTTGDVINDISNVSAASPTTNQVLQYNGTNWVPATLTTEDLVVTCGGNADGTGDDSGAVDTALNDANLGTNDEDFVIDSANLRTLDFRGRHHKIGDSGTFTQINIPFRQDITIKNGTLEFDLNDDDSQDMIKFDSTDEGSLTTTTSTSHEAGDMVLSVTSATNYNAGDLIQIYGDTANDFDVHVEIGASSPTKYKSSQVAVIASVDTTNNKLHLEEPLFTAATVGAAVERWGGGTTAGDGGVNQIRNIVFEDLTFRDKRSKMFFFETSNPITLDSDTTVTFTLPSGHGIAAGGGVRCRLWDVDLTDDTDKTTHTQINDTWINIDSVSGDTATITLQDSATATTTGSGGGDNGWGVISRHTCINLRYARDVVFRNCTFDGWNEEAVRLYRCKNVTFEDCTFKNCRGSNTADACIKIVESGDITVRNCRFQACHLGIATGHADNRLSHGLVVDKCYFNCWRAIYNSHPVDDYCYITDNKFNQLVPNYKRVHLARDSTWGSSDPIHMGGGVSSATITGNDMTGRRKSPSTALSTTAFWGAGDGFTAHTTETGSRFPTARYGMFVVYYNNPHISANNQKVGLKGIDISHNKIECYERYGILFYTQYSPTEGGSQFFGNINISNNSITSGQDGIQISERYTAAGNSSLIDGLSIINNIIFVERFVLKHSGNIGSGYTTLRGIYLRMNDSNRIARGMISGNRLIAAEQIGQGILLYGGSVATGTMARTIIDSNFIEQFNQSLRTYSASNASNRDPSNYTKITNNILRDSGGAAFHGQGSFEAYGNNHYGSDNRDW